VEVVPEQRRTGVGQELMSNALTLAAARGIETSVIANHCNPAAVALYSKLGGIATNGDDLLFDFPAPLGQEG
jgi:ribosomal protein S18 acetylase RimI-like enzyme